VKEIPEYMQMMLFDSQTSGGLLLSVSENNCLNFETACNNLTQPFWKVGEVVEGKGIQIS
jgi:selenophosphate synthase